MSHNIPVDFTVILTAPLPPDSLGVPSLPPGATLAAGLGPQSLSCLSGCGVGIRWWSGAASSGGSPVT